MQSFPSRSTVLYYFKETRLPYRAVLDDLFGRLLDALRGSMVASGSLVGRIEDAVGVFVDYMWMHPIAARLAVRESVNSDPGIREEMRARALPFLGLLVLVFEEGRRSGVFRALRFDPNHVVSIIAGSTLFCVDALPAIAGESPADLLSEDHLEAYKREVLDITRRLLGIRDPRSSVDSVPVA